MYKIKNVLDYRYRMIPTKEEYEMYSSNYRTREYDTIPPIIDDRPSAVVFNTLPRLDSASPVANRGIYDNKLKGWVIGSLNVDIIEAMSEPIGMSHNRVEFYRMLGKLVAQKFAHFVMPSEYIYSSISFRQGEVAEANDPTTSNMALPTGAGWKINTVVNNLTERFYVSLMQVVEPLYPKFMYEFSKYACVSDMFTGMATDVDSFASNLQYMREANHIDGSTMMHSANTPEVGTILTPEAMLNKYMSSVFKTQNNKEDNLTETMKHFEEMVNHLVGVVAYTCFIPN